MDNPETLATLRIRHRTKTNKTKDTTETKRDEQQHGSHQNTRADFSSSLPIMTARAAKTNGLVFNPSNVTGGWNPPRLTLT